MKRKLLSALLLVCLLPVTACGGNAAFAEALTGWIAALRQAYGTEVPILFLTGMMNNGCRTELLSVLSACGGEEAGLWELRTVESNRFGANGHPNLTAHTDVAAEIAAWLARMNILGGEA